MSDRQKWPDWKLERVLLGELPADELAQARADLASSDSLRQRLEDLERSDAEIRANYPAKDMAESIRKRLADVNEDRANEGHAYKSHADKDQPDAMVDKPWARGLAVAAAGVAALGLGYLASGYLASGYPAWPDATPPPTARPSAGTETTRTKGMEPSLQIYRKSDGGPEKLADNTAATAGDVVQLGYVSAGQSFGAVVSLDGRGVVTLHYPTQRDADQATRLQSAGQHLLDHAYQLDDAPGFERFFFVTRDRQPVDVDRVIMAIKRLDRHKTTRLHGRLELPNNYGQTSFLIRKTP